MPLIVPTQSGPPTATFIVPPETNTPPASPAPIPSSTPVASNTPLDTVTPADTATPTASLASITPTGAAETPTAGTGSPTSGTDTPVAASGTKTPGSSHGATITLVTASKVGNHYAPEGVTTEFTAGTSVVYAVAKIHGKAKGDVVKFVWHYPDGSSFSLDIPDVTPYRGDVTAYAQIVPRGPGTYAVSTTINGHNLASVTFVVAARGATPVAASGDTATP